MVIQSLLIFPDYVKLDINFTALFLRSQINMYIFYILLSVWMYFFFSVTDATYSDQYISEVLVLRVLHSESCCLSWSNPEKYNLYFWVAVQIMFELVQKTRRKNFSRIFSSPLCNSVLKFFRQFGFHNKEILISLYAFSLHLNFPTALQKHIKKGRNYQL